MYWYNLGSLEKDILENKLTDKHVFYYFLASSIISVISANFVSDYETGPYVSTTRGLVLLLITIWGCYTIFKANSSGDGKDFFKRFFALSWVVGFRCFVWLCLILFVYFSIILVIQRNEIELNTGISGHFPKGTGNFIMGTLFYIIYFQLLRNSFKRVSVNSSSQEIHSKII